MRSRRGSRTLENGHKELNGRFAKKGSSEMSGHRTGRPSHLVYGLLAIILFGGYVLFNDFQNDNSATMAPTLTLNR